MDYAETLDYLLHRLPSFQRIGAAAYRADLGNIVTLSKQLGDPHTQFPSIHIAGTNGKGSVAHFLASIFQEAGYKTGLYTSPHLKDFRERIRINGEMIAPEYVVAFTEEIRSSLDRMEASFFEITVAMAFAYFSHEKVDMAIVETGMGGRLDSTNILHPELCIITNIGWDHMAFLGQTLPDIAREKAGIIKRGVPVVIGHAEPGLRRVFQETADRVPAPLHFAGDVFPETSHRYTVGDGLSVILHDAGKQKAWSFRPGLHGRYQAENIRTVATTVGLLREQGWTLSDRHVQDGVKKVVENTSLLGRWQVLDDKGPLVVADAMHNLDGIRATLEQLPAIGHQHLHVVFGTVNDKDITAILQALPRKATYYFCKAGLPRALDAERLAQQALQAGLQGHTFPTVKDAVQAAWKAADKQDLVLIGGSIFVVAEAIA